MALGGGTYTVQNKILPGAYFQFLSNNGVNQMLSDRGVAAMGLVLNWGADGKIFDVTAEDLAERSLEIFGYSYGADELKAVRDIFRHASVLHCYRLNGSGVKAANDYAEAVCSGTRGNDLLVVIQENIDDNDQFDVMLYLDQTLVDSQTVTSAVNLVDNHYVVWKKDAELVATAGTPLGGGANRDEDVESHQKFLDLLEAYPDTNALGYAGTDAAVKALYAAYTTRMRDEVGIRFQTAVYDYRADSCGVVNVKNKAVGTEPAGLIYWAVGVLAGMAVNESATNLNYDGEYEIEADYTKKELESAIKNGEWVLHRVGNETHVLEDLNSLVTTSENLGEVFKDNQTIRVIDTIATSIANVFATKYLGKVPNNDSGRISLWSDVVTIHQQLSDLSAIEDFDSESVTIAQGDTKKSVVIDSAVTVVNTMVRLYMKTAIS